MQEAIAYRKAVKNNPNAPIPGKLLEPVPDKDMTKSAEAPAAPGDKTKEDKSPAAPEANPRRSLSISLCIPRIKNTIAEPRVVPKKGISNPASSCILCLPSLLHISCIPGSGRLKPKCPIITYAPWAKIATGRHPAAFRLFSFRLPPDHNSPQSCA